MREETRQVKKYIAEDGREFGNKESCLNYEEELKIQKIRDEFLTGAVSELFKDYEGIEIKFEDGNFHISVNGFAPEGNLEDFISKKDFKKIKREADIRYRCSLDVSWHYWKDR